MTLITTTLWTGLSTFIKIISTYITWKIIAVYTGPTGLVIIEQFQNFVQICRSLSCSLNQGIIKYISEFKDDATKKSRILSTALIIYIVISVIATLILCTFSAELSIKVFNTPAYQNALILLGISITLYSLNCLLLSFLNGEFEIKKYATCNIANTFLILTTTCFLVIYHGLHGAIIGFVLNQSLVLLVTIYFVFKCKSFKLNYCFKGLDKDSANKLVKFAAVSFVPILVAPLTSMILRRYIAHDLSWQEAGYWQGIMKLSDGYLILMELMINIYFLPKISSIKLLSEFKEEIFYSYRLIIPVTFIGLVTIFLLKKQIVSILYTTEFYPMLDLFKYQLIGDMARIGTWLLTNVMAAKAMIKILVISEISFNISYILLTILCVHYFGLIGTAIGFTLNSLIYFTAMTICTIKCVRSGAFHLQLETS